MKFIFNHEGIESLCEEILEDSVTAKGQNILELRHLMFCYYSLRNDILDDCKALDVNTYGILQGFFDTVFTDHALTLYRLQNTGNIFYKTYFIVFYLLSIVKRSFDNFMLYSKNGEFASFILQEAILRNITILNFNIYQLAG